MNSPPMHKKPTFAFQKCIKDCIGSRWKERVSQTSQSRKEIYNKNKKGSAAKWKSVAIKFALNEKVMWFFVPFVALAYETIPNICWHDCCDHLKIVINVFFLNSIDVMNCYCWTGYDHMYTWIMEKKQMKICNKLLYNKGENGGFIFLI